ncbi:hypothetical protein [Aporhodopirellula aestuarii]|uniref:Uncharacterized protein n=1 Tax=Aporhodopirellula aestuarii TaxID=2950107 RepID=A0ABT0UDF4_9BACT|nr:hypothetical protein [Aporhodopirellula aestuarii]MCM2374500.1 hypothetical protein [Aporhodopirellula aestuarii]
MRNRVSFAWSWMQRLVCGPEGTPASPLLCSRVSRDDGGLSSCRWSSMVWGWALVLLVSASVVADEYTFSCWQNGWRKNANDHSADIFGIETNRYGFTLDVADFRNVRVGRIASTQSYAQAARHKAEKFKQLPPATLLIEIDIDGTKYRASTCAAGLEEGVKRLSSVRMWESGRYVQHYDFLGLAFRDAAGKGLDCDARLDLVAWPGSITFNLIVSGELKCSTSVLSLGLTSEAGSWRESITVDGPWDGEREYDVTVTCPITPVADASVPNVSVATASGTAIPVRFDDQKSCFVASVNQLRRRWKTGNTDIRNYDEFDVTVSGGGPHAVVPLLVDMRPPANVIGVCPILCDEEGRPTGIPVQLSKNWHYTPMGSYVMTYMMLPAEKSTTYRLRFSYGFYGTLPSASHAQLCLIGYGGNGRWDQLAIGCWGETICFDVDMSLVDVAITDIRTLMTRNGRQGKKWGWTNAGWGGDWLNIRDAKQKKYLPNGVKTAYVSHGPCLTDVRHEGYYGENQEVAFAARVQTLRTDDYCRTFQKLRYTFERDVEADDIWLFKLGRTFSYRTPRLDYGHAGGLIESLKTPADLTKGQRWVDEVELSGDAPYWIAFTGAEETPAKNNMPNGYRALIVRRFEAVIGGETYAQPTIGSPVHADNPVNLDLELLPPDGIRQFTKGDQIEMDLELITLPRQADDYYGPNQSFRNHLAENPNSWKTTYREARGNKLDVHVVGGRKISSYPIVVQVSEPEVTVTIQGGVGAVPIQFQGLDDIRNCRLFQVVDGERIALDQSVHGNDFWQTDFDSVSKTYQMTFNLPLSEMRESRWVLTH